MLASFAVFGCSSDKSITHSTEVAPTGLPSGWTRTEDKASGLSIGVAPDWKAQNLSANLLKRSGEEIAKENPDQKDTMQAADDAASNNKVKLFVSHDPEGNIAFAPNINVIETPMPPGVTGPEAVDLNVKTLQSSYQDVSKTTTEHLDIGDAEVVSAKQTLKLQGTPVTLDMTFYFVFPGKNMVVLTSTVPEGSKLGPDMDAMAKTLNYKG